MLLQRNTLEIQAGYEYSRFPAKGTTTKRQQIVFCIRDILLSHHQLNLEANRKVCKHEKEKKRKQHLTYLVIHQFMSFLQEMPA